LKNISPARKIYEEVWNENGIDSERKQFVLNLDRRSAISSSLGEIDLQTTYSAACSRSSPHRRTFLGKVSIDNFVESDPLLLASGLSAYLSLFSLLLPTCAPLRNHDASNCWTTAQQIRLSGPPYYYVPAGPYRRVHLTNFADRLLGVKARIVDLPGPPVQLPICCFSRACANKIFGHQGHQRFPTAGPRIHIFTMQEGGNPVYWVPSCPSFRSLLLGAAESMASTRESLVFQLRELAECEKCCEFSQTPLEYPRSSRVPVMMQLYKR